MNPEILKRYDMTVNNKFIVPVNLPDYSSLYEKYDFISSFYKRDLNQKLVEYLLYCAREIAGIAEIEEEEAVDIKPGKRNQLNISLEAISEDFKEGESQVETSYLTHHEIGNDRDGAWDMVAKGRILTEAYDKEKQFQEATKSGVFKKKRQKHNALIFGLRVR